MKRKAIIVDMDDTICKNTTGRPWYGKGAAEGMLQDEPVTDLIDMIRTYCSEYEIDLLILTGRHVGKETEATLEWLDKNWFCPDRIYSRPLNDYSKTVIYKEKTYTEQIEPYYDVVMVFEDNNACVQMFRDKGLIVLQPQNSDY